MILTMKVKSLYLYEDVRLLIQSLGCIFNLFVHLWCYTISCIIVDSNDGCMSRVYEMFSSTSAKSYKSDLKSEQLVL